MVAKQMEKMGSTWRGRMQEETMLQRKEIISHVVDEVKDSAINMIKNISENNQNSGNTKDQF